MDRSVGKSQRRMMLMAGVAAALAGGVGAGGGVAALMAHGTTPTFLERGNSGQQSGIPYSAQFARRTGRKAPRNFSKKAYGRRLRRAHARAAGRI